MCRPKHVEQLKNNEIINSTIRLHLVGSFYEIHRTEEFMKCAPSQRPATKNVCKEAAITVFELLMVCGVSLETC